MKIDEVKHKLDEICNKNDICEIFRDNLDAIQVEGMPIKFNNTFLLFAYNYDFEFDGYKIYKINNISHIKYDDIDKFISYILKKENIKPTVYNLKDICIDGFKNIFRIFLKKNENLVVECEKNNKFYIGKIISIYEDYILFLGFDAEGFWEKEANKIFYKDITSISFGNRYLKYMSKYVHNEDEKI